MGIAGYGFCIEGIVIIFGLLFIRSYDRFSRTLKAFMLINLISLVIIKVYSQYGIVFLLSNENLSLDFISRITILVKAIQGCLIILSFILVLKSLKKNMNRIKYYRGN